jgi:hypothetical protein
MGAPLRFNDLGARLTGYARPEPRKRGTPNYTGEGLEFRLQPVPNGHNPSIAPVLKSRGFKRYKRHYAAFQNGHPNVQRVRGALDGLHPTLVFAFKRIPPRLPGVQLHSSGDGV